MLPSVAALQRRLVTLVTQRDGVRFSTPELRIAAEGLLAAQLEYQEVQSDVVQRIVEVLSTYVDLLNGVVEVCLD